MKIEALPYHRETSTLYATTMADEPWGIFLDSAGTGTDVLACRPRLRLLSNGKEHRLEDAAGNTVARDSDPFILLNQALTPPTGSEANAEIDFPGGALGYLGYDLGRLTEPLQTRLQPDLKVPEAAVGIYDWAVVINHTDARCHLVAQDNAILPEALRHRLHMAVAAKQSVREHASPAMPEPTTSTGFEAEMTPAAYQRAFSRIQRYIEDGDCYQVNLAVRFTYPCSTDPWILYARLRDLNPAPHAAFMRLPGGAAVLCCSPERFLHVCNGHVQTCPIKGTRPRATDPARDTALARELQQSAKDRAENLMIVDLLRNDLGKTCNPGSIVVPALYELQSFATVHHLVSRITGTLAPGCSALDLLRGCFPGGSVTGAPKLRAMQIIEELETCRRNVYCGSFIRLGYDGNLDSNIAIRTLVQEANRLYLWSGGGLVADSSPEAEYREILDKAAAFFHLFTPPRVDHQAGR